jgi:hypothetical protein
MTEPLPISIYACDDLMQKFVKIASVCNKLEAQFNFQTMTANWYGDEDNVLFVRLCLETPLSFTLNKKSQSQHDLNCYSDDVYSYFESSENKQSLMSHIAITETELTMLNQQNKLLAGLLQIKLQKVLNLIAKQLKLDAI